MVSVSKKTVHCLVLLISSNTSIYFRTGLPRGDGGGGGGVDGGGIPLLLQIIFPVLVKNVDSRPKLVKM